jgi:rare lipoprotein A
LIALAALALCPGCFQAVRRPSLERVPAAAVLEEGVASYYGLAFQGRKTASGERFDLRELTAAHRTLRFGTCVTVLNLNNQKHIDVRINDRGPFAKGRIIDVSQEAARRLGMVENGSAPVRLYLCPGR